MMSMWKAGERAGRPSRLAVVIAKKLEPQPWAREFINGDAPDRCWIVSRLPPNEIPTVKGLTDAEFTRALELAKDGLYYCVMRAVRANYSKHEEFVCALIPRNRPLPPGLQFSDDCCIC